MLAYTPSINNHWNCHFSKRFSSYSAPPSSFSLSWSFSHFLDIKVAVLRDFLAFTYFINPTHLGPWKQVKMVDHKIRFRGDTREISDSAQAKTPRSRFHPRLILRGVLPVQFFSLQAILILTRTLTTTRLRWWPSCRRSSARRPPKRGRRRKWSSRKRRGSGQPIRSASICL